MRRVVSVYLPTWSTDRWEKRFFFFEKKKQKTFDYSVPCRRPPGDTPTDKSLFASFSSEKEESSSLILHHNRLVHACNNTAACFGIYAGMKVAQAQAMIPDLRVEAADPEGDAAALKRLAGWCLRFSPLAAPCAPDAVWIDITGCAHLHGGEERLLHAVLQRLAEGGVAARVAVADTPGAAHAVARHGLDALCVVPPGGQAAALDLLPVAALRLAPEVADGLRRLGFDTVGQVAAAPRGPLARRFGNVLLHRLDQALGRAPEPLEPVAPAGQIRVRQGFPEPIATPDDLARVTGLLVERLCEKLRGADVGASRLDLVFVRVDGSPQMVRVGTAAATRDAAHVQRLLATQIETVDPGFGVESVWLAAPLVAKLGARQLVSDLAADPGAADLAGLIDTLLNRLGADNLFRVAAVESDVPERSVRRVAPGVASRGGWPSSLPRPPR
ncbi:MAG TPA: DNA polymerase Y family protein, partial [Acetobacteraceae bacterium]|nr:DNA polymerase Y family protein [Acetobacteraceae bacterium]